MAIRRSAYVSSSEDDDDDVVPTPYMLGSRLFTSPSEHQKQVEMKLPEEEEEEEADPVPIGEVVRVSGKGSDLINHYKGFEFAGNQYQLEDPVLFTPDEKDVKPYVGIIKDITQTRDGSMMVYGQWLYRPEDVVKNGGANCRSYDARELFHSFHFDEVPASSVLHKCVLHFVPNNKQWPIQKQHPGFIVQKFYDHDEQKLWRISNKDYLDSIQRDIDMLIQKTLSRLGDLPDIETKHAAVDQNDYLKIERTPWEMAISPIDISTDDEVTARNSSEYHTILSKAKVLTGKAYRDNWLERLLEGVQKICSYPDRIQKGFGSYDVNQVQERSGNSCKSFKWPESAVPAVAALEKAANDAHSDFQKYNQKLRQLVFNLKNNALLAFRLLNGELKPSKIVNMSPEELKEGLTADEMPRKEPLHSEPMQMTDAQCSRCNGFKVGLKDIILVGCGDRYQLECMACGNIWYDPRNVVSKR